jgi:hypothetical protein
MARRRMPFAPDVPAIAAVPIPIMPDRTVGLAEAIPVLVRVRRAVAG